MRFLLYPYKTIEGVKIPVSFKWTFNMLKQIYNETYEGGELNILRNTLNVNDKVLEIGTGLGLISTFCAQKVGDESVYTYEANPNLEPVIEKTYSINNVSPHHTTAIISTKESKTNFYIEPVDIWASSLMKHSNTALSVELNSLEINKIIKAVNPNYLIMDIEGYEYELLPYISWKNIRKIQVEIHTKFLGPDKTNEIIQTLDKQGFNIHSEYSREEQYYFYKK